MSESVETDGLDLDPDLKSRLARVQEEFDGLAGLIEGAGDRLVAQIRDAREMPDTPSHTVRRWTLELVNGSIGQLVEAVGPELEYDEEVEVVALPDLVAVLRGWRAESSTVAKPEMDDLYDRLKAAGIDLDPATDQEEHTP
jgi:hypothetical protein